MPWPTPALEEIARTGTTTDAATLKRLSIALDRIWSARSDVERAKIDAECPELAAGRQYYKTHPSQVSKASDFYSFMFAKVRRRKVDRIAAIEDALFATAFFAVTVVPQETFLKMCAEQAEGHYFANTVDMRKICSPSQFNEAFQKHLEDKKAFAAEAKKQWQAQTAKKKPAERVN